MPILRFSVVWNVWRMAVWLDWERLRSSKVAIPARILLGTHQAQSRELPIELTRHLRGGTLEVLPVQATPPPGPLTPLTGPHLGASRPQGGRPSHTSTDWPPADPGVNMFPATTTTSTPGPAPDTPEPLPGSRLTRTTAAHNPPPEPPGPSGPLLATRATRATRPPGPPGHQGHPGCRGRRGSVMSPECVPLVGVWRLGR